MPFLFKSFLLLAAVVSAGYGKDTVYTTKGNRLLVVSRVVEMDTITTIFYDAKNIPLATAQKAYLVGMASYLDSTYRPSDIFGLKLKISYREITIKKIGNRLEPLPNPKDLPPIRKFNWPAIIVLLFLLVISLIAGDCLAQARVLAGVIVLPFFSIIVGLFCSLISSSKCPLLFDSSSSLLLWLSYSLATFVLSMIFSVLIRRKILVIHR
jgi:hypothetical protein